FGNAFLEAIYFKRPIVVNNYSIYSHDIRPKGFRVVEFDGFISQKTVDEISILLRTPALVEEMVVHNYALASCYYSYTMLERSLNDIICRIFGDDC
ncbi:MAG: hypothetical protein MUO76_18595, partial [Anaerolineaceae bacterium]|nr:hypothetical protein [Anaerolineaceae bacterium]